MNRPAHHRFVPDRLRCGIGWLLGMSAVLLLVGCSSTRQIPLEQFPEGGTGKARVITRDGYSYEFARVAARGDSLIGTYVVVEERVVSTGELAFIDVERHTALPLSQIDRVEIKRLDLANTVLLGAGATLFVIWARSAFEPADPLEESGGGGKPPPGGPD